MKLICDKCGREFKPGNRPDGLPNGIAFNTVDGEVVICTECIIKKGIEKENGKVD